MPDGDQEVFLALVATGNPEVKFVDQGYRGMVLNVFDNAATYPAYLVRTKCLRSAPSDMYYVPPLFENVTPAPLSLLTFWKQSQSCGLRSLQHASSPLHLEKAEVAHPLTVAASAVPADCQTMIEQVLAHGDSEATGSRADKFSMSANATSAQCVCLWDDESDYDERDYDEGVDYDESSWPYFNAFIGMFWCDDESDSMELMHPVHAKHAWTSRKNFRRWRPEARRKANKLRPKGRTRTHSIDSVGDVVAAASEVLTAAASHPPRDQTLSAVADALSTLPVGSGSTPVLVVGHGSASASSAAAEPPSTTGSAAVIHPAAARVDVAATTESSVPRPSPLAPTGSDSSTDASVGGVTRMADDGCQHPNGNQVCHCACSYCYLACNHDPVDEDSSWSQRYYFASAEDVLSRRAQRNVGRFQRRGTSLSALEIRASHASASRAVLVREQSKVRHVRGSVRAAAAAVDE